MRYVGNVYRSMLYATCVVFLFGLATGCTGNRVGLGGFWVGSNWSCGFCIGGGALICVGNDCYCMEYGGCCMGVGYWLYGKG